MPNPQLHALSQVMRAEELFPLGYPSNTTGTTTSSHLRSNSLTSFPQPANLRQRAEDIRDTYEALLLQNPGRIQLKPISSNTFNFCLSSWLEYGIAKQNHISLGDIFRHSIRILENTQDSPSICFSPYSQLVVQPGLQTWIAALEWMEERGEGWHIEIDPAVSSFVQSREGFGSTLESTLGVIREFFPDCKLKESVYRDPEEPEMSWLKVEIFTQLERSEARLLLAALDASLADSPHWHPDISLSLGVG